ncbi:N-acetylmuramoyl-L-alanine amidase [Lactobacillus equicursoris DSM 19284 = JCM 14600 = CIP 110162]|uniref:Mannosyl-glycoprotein endo-beta-N-acetylglucosaminidase n=1 Tax=Lactobacillus equicursoris DSM 19284 = JCM 14600 = CIP 110162 TaxID=1293597 RepID=K0NYU0_9LACO|nr:glycoside hydrolase family 73 protein [Lactobacillus equicursoris]KRL02765.1 mannosyl-glycoprotein endo-beta-N-acetylglucosaminidase [Lactobacillus equicursoris DSM 19284 = JCM 14600 = CIP 110162]MDD6386777.1 glycoside hydrolase family 73 protein [Lactobacillus equicursoris]CCK85105.1 N-acetylmuramoyl-L-alanine amidase [Lactobacillus equicursoris DSM 19284 = JCM 14600 = CIP 110162]
MPRRNRSKNQQTTITIVRVFAIVLLLMGAFVAFRYYRRQALEQEQVRQAELAKKEAAAKLLKQKKDFIKKVAPVAQKVDKGTKLLPSITIAQACLESNYGQSDLAQKYNNLFGVKGTSKTTSAVMTTKEYTNGKWVTVKARFQIYDSYEASIRAHNRLFQEGTTWNKNQYKDVLNAKNYTEQAKALVTDGYATDPDYATKLTNLIEQFNLNQYDN